MLRLLVCHHIGTFPNENNEITSLIFPSLRSALEPDIADTRQRINRHKRLFRNVYTSLLRPWKKKVANIVTTFSCKYLSIRTRYKLILVPDVAAIVLSSSRQFLHRPAPFLPPRYGLPLPIYVCP